MKDQIIRMTEEKTIAIVAHDNKKQDLLAWAKYNREALNGHRIVATGATGALLETELNIPVSRVLSGPLGGDQQIGAKISEGDIDVLIFFWDPLEPLLTIRTSRRCSVSRWSGTYRSPATGRRRIF